MNCKNKCKRKKKKRGKNIIQGFQNLKSNEEICHCNRGRKNDQGDEGGKRSRKFAYVGMKAKNKTRDSEMY